MKNLSKIIDSSIFLTDGGLETDLIYSKNIELPHFAAFPLLDNPKYRDVLKSYYTEYLDIAVKNNTGYLLESPTWRANLDWGYKLGYDRTDLEIINQKAVELLKDIRKSYTQQIDQILLSGQIGPRGDGYQIEKAMTIMEAKDYHDLQISIFKQSSVDLVSAITMTYTDEAIGACLSAQDKQLPIVISFTVETDGKLPSGESLDEAIKLVDKVTENYPIYYMINCAHPSHFIAAIKGNYAWKSRIQGIRANASCKSHSELDESTELDAGNKYELGEWHGRLHKHLPELRVFGGCCGTDASHVSAICQEILASA